ncbi:DUF5686 family protein [Parabacteroides sp. Marseille-P3160]|uniref:DUF5686 family protein n=1 Tax=Parabacteroides sp. Marseille-P3160 TaxID=1917887 RepID=UPI000B4175DD|nr:DUF5686 family protein [Parabacteroides sp. Marseille-P3160]
MKQVIKNAETYATQISRYEADLYVKGYTEIKKQNFLILFAHHIIPVDRKKKQYFFELLSQSTYNSPNNYIHRFCAVNGTQLPDKDKQKEALSFLNINAYTATVNKNQILMPVAPNAFKHYTFELERIDNDQGNKIFVINFHPKKISRSLVSGTMHIVDKSWTIDQFKLKGLSPYARFELQIYFGKEAHQLLLAEKAQLKLWYSVLGNVIETTYHSFYKYKRIEWVNEDEASKKEKEKHRSLDLTEYHQIITDTVPVISDTAFWERVRAVPLSVEEDSLYNTAKRKKEEKGLEAPADSSEKLEYMKLTENLTNSLNFDRNTMHIRYSGILNPFQLGYSGFNGLSYQQRLRIRKEYDDGTILRFNPEIGYVFKRKKIFYKVDGEWEYWPERQGTLSGIIGNGNQAYSSELIDDINELLKDSAFNFDNLNLKYYNDYYVELKNRIELINGLQLTTGVSYHCRIPVKEKGDKVVNEDISDLINEDYNDLSPYIGLTYTPRQYYRMEGRHKEYLYSNFPTMSVEYARGIPGVLGSVGNYERMEADIHQSISLGLLRRFSYHVSGGFFSKQKSVYFADFRYFARRNFPESWNEPIGGRFNLLKSEWYNASNSFAQAHFVYESPFILSSLLNISRYVLTERFYISKLWTPALPNYTELGYGFGNHIFNMAGFLGFDAEKCQGVGLKFTFEGF